ncbi:tyrosine-type recombinase/integrase [Bordetella genomosp. 9]|uniref:tyrosine-type recombinase/integrase n=1 Tax=Bordetella genomosp. 9 TaxID=1416803 RepID=UPI0015C5F9E7|nr:site-specific integrase [Bordetella genomosp. 9]
MAINLLSDTAVRNARPGPKDYDLSDGGGLALRVKTDGSRLWSYRYTSPTAGHQRRVWLGSYPVLGLKAARELRATRAELVAKGVDPKNATALLDEVGNETPATVGQLFAAWFKGYIQVERRKTTDQGAVRNRYEKYVAPVIGAVPLAEVRRGHIMKAIDKARAAGHMRTANLVLAETRQMFRFGLARDWVQGDPTAALTRKDAGGQDREGERVLDPDELVMLRDILRRPPAGRTRYYVATRRVLPAHTELMVWWTLATASRAIEVVAIRRAARCPVDVSRKEWIIPAEVSKNGKTHVVHLSDFAMAVWERIQAATATEGEYVFAGRDGGHLSEKEVTRRLTDRQTRDKPVKGRKNTTDLDLAGGRWTQHDLRRTAATLMGELGFSKEVIDRCLNHKEPGKVTRTYQRQQMMPQRRAAFDALGAYLWDLLGDPRGWLPGTDATPDIQSPA